MDSKQSAACYGTCKACGQQVRWIITTNAKKMPCNPEGIYFTPSGGNETFVTPQGKIVRGKRSGKGMSYGYISHFATCPQADRFRKKEAEKDG